jgi:hypothetical protein
MADAELVIVSSFPNRIEAEIAQGALTAAGIESVISADDAGGQYSSLWMNGVRVMVRQEDASKAQQVLEGPRRDASGH